jgi:hypothetical protein
MFVLNKLIYTGNIKSRNTLMEQVPIPSGVFVHIQHVLNTYHLSFVQVILLVFLAISILAVFLFQETVKDILRGYVRRILYEYQMSSDGKMVDTTHRTASSSLFQWLIYLEHTWLAPSDSSLVEPLPTNVELSERYNIAIPSRSALVAESSHDDMQPNVHLVDSNTF